MYVPSHTSRGLRGRYAARVTGRPKDSPATTVVGTVIPTLDILATTDATLETVFLLYHLSRSMDAYTLHKIPYIILSTPTDFL